jgi:hypothetical protein
MNREPIVAAQEFDQPIVAEATRPWYERPTRGFVPPQLPRTILTPAEEEPLGYGWMRREARKLAQKPGRRFSATRWQRFPLLDLLVISMGLIVLFRSAVETIRDHREDGHFGYLACSGVALLVGLTALALAISSVLRMVR